MDWIHMAKDCDKCRAILKAAMNFKVSCNEGGGGGSLGSRGTVSPFSSVCRVERSELLWPYIVNCARSVPESYYGRISKVCVWNVSTISQHDVQGF
jgi:hypothetical protein